MRHDYTARRHRVLLLTEGKWTATITVNSMGKVFLDGLWEHERQHRASCSG